MSNLYKSVFIRSVLQSLAVLAGLFITGCTAVGPDYVPPDTEVSSSWHTQLDIGLSAEEMRIPLMLA